MTQTIFLLDAKQRLVPLKEARYKSEDLLQELIEKHPKLLAGDQYGSKEPRKWFLVQREMGVADAEDAGHRWSVDHLFVDQDSTPTLIEVKRSTDTRIRREVVGQLLEYAANGTKYWPIDRIKERFEERCEAEGKNADQELAGFLGPDGDVEAFWGKVGDNLKLGRLRLLFVADVIPRELQQIVEFMNEQMTQTEMLAVEIKQFTGKRKEATLVPRVIGLTPAAEAVKTGKSEPPRSVPWDPRSFLAKLESENRDGDLPIAQAIIDWAIENGLRWNGGRGPSKASIWPVLEDGIQPISLYEGTGRCVLHIQFYCMGPRFEEVEARRPIAEAFNRILGVDLDPERPYPGIRFELLESEEARVGMFEALDLMLTALRAEETDEAQQ